MMPIILNAFFMSLAGIGGAMALLESRQGTESRPILGSGGYGFKLLLVAVIVAMFTWEYANADMATICTLLLTFFGALLAQLGMDLKWPWSMSLISIYVIFATIIPSWFVHMTLQHSELEVGTYAFIVLGFFAGLNIATATASALFRVGLAPLVISLTNSAIFSLLAVMAALEDRHGSVISVVANTMVIAPWVIVAAFIAVKIAAMMRSRLVVG